MAKQKKSKKKLFIFGGIGLLLVILIVVAFIGGSKDEIVAVQVQDVQKRDITQTVNATGKISPEFKVIITSEVTGEIVQLPVIEGQNVKKGDLLIRIKPDAYIAQKQRAEANLQSAKANLQMREAELERVTSEYNRVKELHEKGLASDAELETAKSTYLTTKALYESAEANVKQSEASLREIIEQLNKTTIRSPMNGTVTGLNVELGERVLGSGFTQGTNIMTVADLGNMEAIVEVDENDVVLVSLGDTAQVEVDAFPDRYFNGVVTQIGNSATTEGLGTQDQVVNFEVEIKLLELDPELRPGMSCNADIETETELNVLSVPIQSVTARSNGFGGPGTEETPDEDAPTNGMKKEDKLKEIVFVIENSKAQSVEVETGISDDNFIQIISGLEGGEKVVSGSYRAISRELRDGITVRVEEGRKNFGSNK